MERENEAALAKEKFEKDLKEERKRIKAEAKESYKKLVVSHRSIPELENLISEKYEDNDVSVKVVELSTNDIATKNNWIGANQPRYESDNDVSDEPTTEMDNEIPGMELKRTTKPINIKKETKKFDSEKDVKKALKKQATKTVQKSKVFQMKNKLERQKQKKKSRQMKAQRMKFQEQKGKFKRGGSRRAP
nr:uncharacterized protein LOC111513823 [Leptinotarsa decemlineata]